MTEMDSGNINVLPPPPGVAGMMSCDVNRPPTSPALCANQDKEEGHHDNMKLEQQKAQPAKKPKQFITDTLNSNPRDRMALLKLEHDMIDFINSNSPFKKFPQMSSYHRMLVHRVAAYFGMEHNVDQTGKAIIINQTVGTRIPEQRFLQQIHEEKKVEAQQWKAILTRDNSSEEQGLQEGGHAESRALDTRNPFAETQRKRQLYRGSRGGSSGSSWNSSGQQSSTESDNVYSSDPRPWSSTESDSSCQWKSTAPKPRHAVSHAPDARGTGQPFLNPDGTPAVYIPPDSQRPIRSQPAVQQPQPQMEDLSSQFAHVAVSCPSTAEAPPLYPPAQSYIYAAPANQAQNYCQCLCITTVVSFLPQHLRPPPQSSTPKQVPGCSVTYAPSGVVMPLGGEGGYCCVAPAPGPLPLPPPPACGTMAPPTHPATCQQGPSCFGMG
ncbi:hypothetical protein CRUP_011301, partial [Coryphaenoides rupestris]